MIFRALLRAVLLLLVGITTSAAAEKKIVLIAGPITGHPKNTHEYEKSVILLKHLLDTSPNLPGLDVEAHFRGWPAHPETLDTADTIVLISDGGDRNATDHPLYVGDRLQVLAKQMARGCGLVMLHWTTFNPARHHDQITEWVGGYFDYETGQTPNKWYSAIKTWEGPTLLGVEDHPITRGVRPFPVKEEFYYNIRFRENDGRVQPILRTRPPGEPDEQTVAWAVERADGGRGFGFTGGHFYENWWLPDFRRMVLNAIVWTARQEVPAAGIESKLDDPIRALIVTGHNHPAHDWRRTTQALIAVLEQDPRVFVDVTEQPEDLATARITSYDLIVMNYSSWDRPGLSAAAKENFANYVRRGGGLSVIHFANGSFTDTLPNKESDWPEYRTKLVRRIWVHGPQQSGHDAYGPFHVKLTPAGKEHPITAGLAPFDTVDELYYRQMGELPITPLVTARSQDTGQDEPLAWAYQYGDGKVFQTVLGHSDISVRKAGALIRRGTVWTAKRPPLSFDPPLELTEKVLFRDGSPWKLEESLQRSHAAADDAAQRDASQALVPGKFGQALDARVARAVAPARTEFRTPPLTAECWAQIHSKQNFQIVLANELKASPTHWEMFTFAGTGHFTAYLPGMEPDHVRSSQDIADGQWHHLKMIYEPQRVRLFIDGKLAADQPVRPRDPNAASVPGELAIGSLVERSLGCDGVIDEVRISTGVVESAEPLVVRPSTEPRTLGLWRFDQLTGDQQCVDESARAAPARLEAVKKKVTTSSAAASRITGHWGEDAVGFRWTEQDSVDNRFQQMDTGQFFSGTIFTPPSPSRPLSHTAKGICVRIGDRNQAAVCYDTELLRMSAAWTGDFLTLDPARYGIIVPPKVAGDVQFTTPGLPGWGSRGRFVDTRPAKPYGPLPREHGRYQGLYLHGNRVVLSFTVGGVSVLETPWYEERDGVPVITRTLQIAAGNEPLQLLACGPDGVCAIVTESTGTAKSAGTTVPARTSVSRATTEQGEVIVIPPRAEPVQLTVAVASRARLDERQLAERVRELPAVEFASLVAPGHSRWTAELVTQGQRDDKSAGLFTVDTIRLPFDNPYRALLFVSGHDFFSSGDAALCTVHGDVWLASGLDDQLDQVRWKRFATGLFQPLGLKIVNDVIHVVGRDQITRLHDRDENGEADWYENFNNDAHVSTNGHEYVTCLETDRAGNFFFLKGDSGGKHHHDGCLLRVSSDGSRLDVFATGFRNANGLGIGPADQITVSPQEGEWTPASAIFPVSLGGFYGAMGVHHRDTPPRDFDRPICWLPRRVDNSSGGQVWVPNGAWGALENQMLHLSYGQSTLMLIATESVAGQVQGAAIPLPVTFRSGAMRGRFHPREPHLYVSGLRGWVSNAIDDGCFQRVRYRGGDQPLPIQLETRRNGMLVTFSAPVDPESAGDPANYRGEQWNYRWSAQYGSPELKTSQPNVEGRDKVVIESASVLDEGRRVFLEIPNLQPCSVLQIDAELTSRTTSQRSKQTWYQTIHAIRSDSFPESQITRRNSNSALSAAERTSLVPGVVLKFFADSALANRHDGEPTDVDRRRLPSWHVASGESPCGSGKPGPFRVEGQGFLRAPDSGRYRLFARGTGTVKILIGDTQVLDLDLQSQDANGSVQLSEPLDLRDWTPWRLSYEHHSLELPAALRLYWQHEDGFDEPIPPAAFSCLPESGELAARLAQRGAISSMIDHRCARCHELGNRDLAAVTTEGPSLRGIGERVNEKWLAAWLLYPKEMRGEHHMPALLGTWRPGEADETARRQASDLAAWLQSLNASGGEPSEPSRIRFTSLGDSQDGLRLWEQLGCVGCHHLGSPNLADSYVRLSLQMVPWKFSPAQLVAFLREPQRHFSATRMPDFQLTDEEAASLAAFLFTRRQPTFLDSLRLPLGNPHEGKKLAEQFRCHACHDLGQNRIANTTTELRKGLDFKRGDGCLAAADTTRGRAPRLDLSEDERLAVKRLVAGNHLASWRNVPAEEAQRLIESLRCGVCHSRDEQSSTLPMILAEDGELGWLPETLPNLTWTGEKLQEQWMEAFLAGQIPSRPRPHLTARMPAFPQYAKRLAKGMAAQHGMPLRSLNLVAVATHHGASTAMGDLAIGYELTRKERGLDCRQCHAVGSEQAQGDDKTRLAPGINFSLVPQRLHYDFYRRFVLDPPRYDVTTRMPKLAPDGRRTGVQHFYHGDARQQFDAIWGYLQTIPETEP